ncbi:MAG: penicillin-binding protein [Tenacibaculum sp.]
MTLFFVAIIFRVFKIQYIDGFKYRKISQERTIKNDTIYANRGNVYSSDGSLLATSITKFNIHMDVMSVKSKVFERNIRALSDSLSKFLGKTSLHYQKKLRSARKQKNSYLLIAKNIDYNLYTKIRTFPILKLGLYKGGFIAEQQTARVHPIGKIARRTIGYDDFRGGAGIEGAFADYMNGKNGWRLKQKKAKGQWKPINDINEKEPIDGHDVITTLDLNMQDLTHHALLKQMQFFEAEHGCAVIMEVKTGKIKAIANLGISSKGKYYEKRNYAVWESHEPGSTFKLPSLIAALESQQIDTSSVVNCSNGKIFINGNKVEDSKKGGHGKISLARVFEVSCNVGMVKSIQRLYNKKPMNFVDKIKSFGLNQQTGVRIKGEGKAFIPTPYSNNWNPIALEWMAWGYGVSLTPLQTLTFYNAIANNGKLVKPYFVEELKANNKSYKKFDTQVLNKKIISQKTLNKVKKLLENVVKKGTAKNIYSTNFSMAGKTGTAKKWIPKHKDKSGKTVAGYYSDKKYISSFVGYFPADKPMYSCIVVINEPKKIKGYYGSQVAAPVFKEIAQKLYPKKPVDFQHVTDSISYDEIDKDYIKYYIKLKKYKSIMPRVIGMSAMDAIALLENMGLKVNITGMGKVVEQSVENGIKVSRGTRVYLKLS